MLCPVLQGSLFRYHLTKDTLDDEGQDIGRCAPGAGMTTRYWCLLGFLSVVCAPCLLFWFVLLLNFLGSARHV